MKKEKKEHYYQSVMFGNKSCDECTNFFQGFLGIFCSNDQLFKFCFHLSMLLYERDTHHHINAHWALL